MVWYVRNIEKHNVVSGKLVERETVTVSGVARQTPVG